MEKYDSRHRSASTKRQSSRESNAKRGNRQPSKGRKGVVRQIADFFSDKRTRIALGVLLVVVAFVMAICTVSHLKNGVLDQSAVSSGMSVNEIADSGIKIHNAGGALGAWLSHALMTEGLGIGSFVLVVYLGIIGLSLLGAMKCRFWSLTFKCLFSAISISVIAGLLTFDSNSFMHWGGVHGRYANIWLEHIGSILTAYSVSVVLAGCLVAIYLNPIKAFVGKVAELIPRRKKTQDTDTETAPIKLDGFDENDDEHNNDSVGFKTNEVSFGEESTSSGVATSAMTVANASLRLFTIDEEPNEDRQSDDDLATSEEEQPQHPISSDPNTEEPTFTIKTADIEPADNDANVSDSIVSESSPFDPRAELSRYVFPDVDLLEDRPSGAVVDPEEQQRNKDLIVKTLLDYKIPIQRIEATIGPTVTLYEIVPAEGVRIAQIQRLENDIALSLAALGIRIIAPIPGAGTVGIEVPNRDPKTVSIRSVLSSRKFNECRQKMLLPMAMGATISNDIFIEDLAKMPHVLVAGATGQGKSVGLNCIIASLIYAKHPSELKFVFIDPKMVEFTPYRKLERHFLAKLPDSDDPIITDPAKVPATLNSLCVEMDNRYMLMSQAGSRSVEEYNRKFAQRVLNPEKGHRYLPYIVTIVDEFADLIMMGGKEVSMPIARIAQKGRAAGMHMIIATQRPSTDVITGMIKANFPGRIAFRVMQMVDSKTILDRPGANQLIGRGDMLFLHNGRLERVQCAFIDTAEVDAVTDHIDNQIGFENAYLLPEPVVESNLPADGYDPSKRDALFNDCARFIVMQSTASTSSLQRRFGIGYNKAGKIMDQMEAAGIVGAAQGAKPRAVLMDPSTLEALLQNS